MTPFTVRLAFRCANVVACVARVNACSARAIACTARAIASATSVVASATGIVACATCAIATFLFIGTGPALASPAGLPGRSIEVSVPVAEPGPACELLGADIPTRKLRLERSFSDDFDRFDPSEGRWATWFDGGYDPNARRFLGADWGAAKRTLKGNQEQQLYVDSAFRGSGKEALKLDPFSVREGVLDIRADHASPAMKDALYGFEVTSGMISSRPSLVQRFGYFEASLKLPTGKAVWPAFWLLPANKQWPPEIDVLEMYGPKPTEMSAATHWKDQTGQRKSSGCRAILQGADRAFHRYGVLWTPERLVYYIDGAPVSQISTPPGMDVPMFMMVNLAIGGKLTGPLDAETKLPVHLLVDWVGAWQWPGEPPCEPRTSDKEVDRCNRR